MKLKDFEAISEGLGESPDEEAHTIDHCPMGQTCSENRVTEKHEKTISYFMLETCRACPHNYDCPVKITKRMAKLEWEWKRPRLELRRLAHEEDPTLKSLFKQRAGGESTNAELKNSMGLERIRRRGFEATKLVVFLAATALNIGRMHGWLRRKALEQLSNIDSILAKWLVLTLLGAMTSLFVVLLQKIRRGCPARPSEA